MSIDQVEMTPATGIYPWHADRERWGDSIVRDPPSTLFPEDGRPPAPLPLRPRRHLCDSRDDPAGRAGRDVERPVVHGPRTDRRRGTRAGAGGPQGRCCHADGRRGAAARCAFRFRATGARGRAPLPDAGRTERPHRRSGRCRVSDALGSGRRRGLLEASLDDPRDRMLRSIAVRVAPRHSDGSRAVLRERIVGPPTDRTVGEIDALARLDGDDDAFLRERLAALRPSPSTAAEAAAAAVQAMEQALRCSARHRAGKSCRRRREGRRSGRPSRRARGQLQV